MPVSRLATPNPPKIDPPEPTLSTAPDLPESPEVLCFDVETNGFGLIIQIGYVRSRHSEDKRVCCEMVKLPPGAYINRHALKIHRICIARVRREGKRADLVLGNFLDECDRVVNGGGLVIAHNAAADASSVRKTLEAWGINRRFDVRVFCTMKESKVWSPLLDKRGHIKAFKNIELHHHLLGPLDDSNAHDAGFDAGVTLACYWAGVTKGWWAAPGR